MTADQKFRLARLAERFHLTARQAEVFLLICEDKAQKEIAAALNVDENTVWGHMVAVREKAGAKSTAGAIANICLSA